MTTIKIGNNLTQVQICQHFLCDTFSLYMHVHAYLFLSVIPSLSLDMEDFQEGNQPKHMDWQIMNGVTPMQNVCKGDVW